MDGENANNANNANSIPLSAVSGERSTDTPPVENRPEQTQPSVVKYDTSLAVVERYTRTKAEREKAKGKKAGSPGRFHGEQLQFLQSKLADYEALANFSGDKRRNALSTFWHSAINAGFWVKFDLNDVRTTVSGHASMKDDDIIARQICCSDLLVASTSVCDSWPVTTDRGNITLALDSQMKSLLSLIATSKSIPCFNRSVSVK